MFQSVQVFFNFYLQNVCKIFIRQIFDLKLLPIAILRIWVKNNCKIFMKKYCPNLKIYSIMYVHSGTRLTDNNKKL